jgi:ABC-2 type transport system permease protein
MITQKTGGTFSQMASALSVEFTKLAHSKMLWATALASCLIAGISGLFMFILKDPERARNLGIVGAKAQIFGGTADWPNLFNLGLLMTGIAGLIIFGIIFVWIIGREFGDRTVFEWLSVPVSRLTTMFGKLAVAAIWSMTLVCVSFLLLLVSGWALQLPGWSPSLVARGFGLLLGTGLLSVCVCVPFTFVASMTRGYLAALGTIFLALILGQVISQLGYGQYFPWMIPMFYSGAAEALTGKAADPPGFASYAIVGITFAAGLVALAFWWRRADQT